MAKEGYRYTHNPEFVKFSAAFKPVHGSLDFVQCPERSLTPHKQSGHPAIDFKQSVRRFVEVRELLSNENRKRNHTDHVSNQFSDDLPKTFFAL